jgi:hypothetical protein
MSEPSVQNLREKTPNIRRGMRESFGYADQEASGGQGLAKQSSETPSRETNSPMRQTGGRNASASERRRRLGEGARRLSSDQTQGMRGGSRTLLG